MAGQVRSLRLTPLVAGLCVSLVMGCSGDSRVEDLPRAAGERGSDIIVGAPGEGPEAAPTTGGNPDADPSTLGGLSPEQRIARGAAVFLENCASCHQGQGQGIEGEVPPLAGSDFLNADKERAIRVVANGLDGEVVVNGHEFASRMPSLGLSDDDVSSVLTYVFSQWGNSGQVVLPEEVTAIRR